jgi:8-oxo-dGTP pyrophosphatase MutT (NUDIX family)
MGSIKDIGKALNSRYVRIIEPGDRAHSAVALIFEETPEGPKVLFIERSSNEHDRWSGQIGLPGGRSEQEDVSPRKTAERETWEELGLDLREADYLGRISDIAPGGLRIVVSCFVYQVKHHPILCLNNDEIADAFWVPFTELTEQHTLTQVQTRVRNRLRTFPALKIGKDKKQPLWGLTYRLVRNLNKVIASSSLSE